MLLCLGFFGEGCLFCFLIIAGIFLNGKNLAIWKSNFSNSCGFDNFSESLLNAFIWFSLIFQSLYFLSCCCLKPLISFVIFHLIVFSIFLGLGFFCILSVCCCSLVSYFGVCCGLQADGVPKNPFL